MFMGRILQKLDGRCQSFTARRLDARPGLLSAGVTFFRGHDVSGGLILRGEPLSFPRKRESRNVVTLGRRAENDQNRLTSIQLSGSFCTNSAMRPHRPEIRLLIQLMAKTARHRSPVRLVAIHTCFHRSFALFPQHVARGDRAMTGRASVFGASMSAVTEEHKIRQ